MARLSHCISLFCSWGILAVALAGSLFAQAEPPLRGSQAGSERWIVWLKDRGFDLHARLRTIRTETNAASRRQLLAQLQQVVVADQQALVGQVTTPVLLHFGTWAPNLVPGLCIEHIAQPFTTNSGVLNYAGMARWSVMLPTDMQWLHTDIAVQGTVLSNPNLRTNAMRAVLGGGL